MITTLLSAADRIASPWKNGGGVTREIAAWPEGSGLDGFDWRISMAEVRQPGAFSVFPEVDRWLTVIEGTLVLTVGADTPAFLDGGSDPLAFPGDRPCHGAPVGGAVLDLNLMIRRGRFIGRVERIADASWRPSGQTALLVALEPLAVGAETLNRFDALRFTEIDPMEAPALYVGGQAVAIALDTVP
jgi:environmental stress-induced protein Ves